MNTFKRVLSLLLAVVMTVTMLAACGNKVEDEPLTPPVTLDAPVTEPPVTEAPVTEPPVTSTEPTTTPEPVTEPPVTTTEATTVTEATTKATTTDKNSFTVEDMSAVMYATDSVNVRKGPSADFDKIGRFEKGDAVTVTGRASTGWFRVDYKGSVGYMSNAYLSDKKPADVVTTKTTTAKEPDVIIDDGDGDVNIDDDDNTTATTPTTSGNAQIDAVLGDPIADNGLTYMMAQMYDDRYVTVVKQILEGIKNFETTIRVDPIITEDETKDFANLIIPLLACEYCYVDNLGASARGGKLSEINVTYNVSTVEDGLAMVEKLRSAANKPISALKSSWSDYEKVRYLHDWLVLKCTPDENNVGGKWATNAYGAIVDGRPTCLGYAKAMFYLLNKAGFKTVYCVGMGHTARHIWVKVNIDGTWYNIDPTWDDPVDQTKGDPNYVRYDYFLVDDAFMARTHAEVFNMRFFDSKKANSLTYNWHNVNGCYAQSYDEAVTMVKNATKKAVESGGDIVYVRIKFANEADYLEFTNNYKKSGFNNNILAGISSKYTCEEAFPGSTTWTRTYKLVKK